MISCKFAARLLPLGCLLVCLSACQTTSEPPVEPSWIGLDQSGVFVLRHWLQPAEANSSPSSEVQSILTKINARQSQPCTAVRVGIIGDTRAAFDGLGISIFFRPMLEEMAARESEVILHVGDLVKRGTSEEEWFAYAQSIEGVPPLVTVRGNHDRGPYFYDRLFGTAPVFALDYGPLRIFGLDTEDSPEVVRSLLPKLSGLLKAPTDKWKLVILHRPIWSQGLHGNDEIGLNAELTQLFESANVHLVFSGHDHNYERFCPTIGVSPSRECVRAEQAPNYVVTGGGATMPNPLPTFWRRFSDDQARAAARTSVAYSGSLHFAEVEASPTTLKYQAVRSKVGNLRPSGVIDAFRLNKTSNQCSP